jgi:hypothetical protein
MTGSPASRLSRRDLVASGTVVAAVVVYVLRAVGAALPGLGSVRATATAVLALGFVASASAVVPTFDRLIHGNKLYLGATSLGCGVGSPHVSRAERALGPSRSASGEPSAHPSRHPGRSNLTEVWMIG